MGGYSTVLLAINLQIWSWVLAFKEGWEVGMVFVHKYRKLTLLERASPGTQTVTPRYLDAFLEYRQTESKMNFGKLCCKNQTPFNHVLDTKIIAKSLNSGFDSKRLSLHSLAVEYEYKTGATIVI